MDLRLQAGLAKTVVEQAAANGSRARFASAVEPGRRLQHRLIRSDRSPARNRAAANGSYVNRSCAAPEPPEQDLLLGGSGFASTVSDHVGGLGAVIALVGGMTEWQRAKRDGEDETRRKSLQACVLGGLGCVVTVVALILY